MINQKEETTETKTQENSVKSKIISRKGQAHWEGTLKEGKGSLSTQSGILKQTNYSYKTRFAEGESGTNPEELLASAHAGCYTMAVNSLLTKKEKEVKSLDTEATISLENLAIKDIHLSITGSVNNISEEEFSSICKEAEKTCIISKALNVPISSEAKLA